MKINVENVKKDFNTLCQLTLRGLKIFLKDKANVFFSLMGPLIVLVLYVLFLGDVQVDSVMSYIPEGVVVDEKAVKAYVDCWMLAGVLSIACISVSFSANSVMVQDKTRGILNDGLSSPVKKEVIKASYFCFNFIVTTIIVAIVYVICLIYLAASGGWFLTAGDVFGLIGVLLLSTLSATLITVFICGFLKTEAQHGGFVGVISSVLGFLIGAYMPMSIMPKVAQYVSAFIPGSHSAGLFRQYLMAGPLDNLAKTIPPQAVDGLAEAFTMEVNFFGTSVSMGGMYLYVAASVVIFAVLNVVFSFRKKLK